MTYIFIACICFICLFYIVSYRESNRLVWKEYTFASKAIHQDKKIIFFSDVHIGKWYHSNHLIPLITLINSQNPDVLIFGGDFIDHYERDKKRLDIDWIIEQMQLLQCSHKLCVKGNHDGSPYKEIMKKSGFRLLSNEDIIIDGLQIYGLEDALCGHPLHQFQLHEDKFHIVVVHEPDATDDIDNENIDLILSGHTHGGQVAIPFIKQLVLPKMGKHYLKGLYSITKRCSLIVSSGIGRTGLPFRLGNTPEVVILHINTEND